MKKIITTKYEVEPQDINLLKFCLNYCWHRATKHKTPMSERKDEINRLRREMDIIK